MTLKFKKSISIKLIIILRISYNFPHFFSKFLPQGRKDA